MILSTALDYFDVDKGCQAEYERCNPFEEKNYYLQSGRLDFAVCKKCPDVLKVWLLQYIKDIDNFLLCVRLKRYLLSLYCSYHLSILRVKQGY